MVVSLAKGPGPGEMVFKELSSGSPHPSASSTASFTDPEAAPKQPQSQSQSTAAAAAPAPAATSGASAPIKRMSTDERRRSSMMANIVKAKTLARVMTKLSVKLDTSSHRLRGSSRTSGSHGDQMRRAAISARRTRPFFHDPQGRLKSLLSAESAPFLHARIHQDQLLPAQVYQLHDFDFNLRHVLEEGEFHQTHEAVFSRQRSNPQSRKHPYRIKFIQQAVVAQSDEDEVALERAAVRMMMEGLYLAHLSHLNIIQLRGHNSGGLSALQHEQPEHFFFLTDQIGETLPQRLESWKKWATALAKIERRKRNKPKTPLVPKTGESSTTTVLKDKLIRTYPEDLIVLKTNYALQLLNALSYLHERRIVLRELRPDAIGFCAYPHHHTVQIIDLTTCKEVPRDSKLIPPEADWQMVLRPSMRTLIMPDVSQTTCESSRCLSPVAEDSLDEGIEVVQHPHPSSDLEFSECFTTEHEMEETTIIPTTIASVGQSVTVDFGSSHHNNNSRHLATVTEGESLQTLESSKEQQSNTTLPRVSSLKAQDLMTDDSAMTFACDEDDDNEYDESHPQLTLASVWEEDSSADLKPPAVNNNNNSLDDLGSNHGSQHRRRQFRASFLTADRQFSLHSLAADSTSSDDDEEEESEASDVVGKKNQEQRNKRQSSLEIDQSETSFATANDSDAPWSNPFGTSTVSDGDESTTTEGAQSLPPKSHVRRPENHHNYHHPEDKSSGSACSQADGGVFGIKTTVAARRYMAPDLYGGIVTESGSIRDGYDMQADIYSWAMVFAEILTETRPYGSRQLTRDWHKIVTGKLRPNIQRHHFPRVVKGILEQAWDARPEKRGTAEQLSKSMERVLLMLEGRNKPWDPSSAMKKQQLQRQTAPSALDLLRKTSAEDLEEREREPTLPERATKYKRWMAKEPAKWTDLWNPRSNKKFLGDETDIAAEIQDKKRDLFTKRKKKDALEGI